MQRHWPPRQAWPAAHARPQAPQFAASLWRSLQSSPPQSALPGGHAPPAAPTQAPPRHLVPERQTLPHAPQFLESVRTGTQLVLPRSWHACMFAGHAQLPSVHLVPEGHALPQTLQFLLSVRSEVHLPEHSRLGGRHCLAARACPGKAREERTAPTRPAPTRVSISRRDRPSWASARARSSIQCSSDMRLYPARSLTSVQDTTRTDQASTTQVAPRAGRPSAWATQEPRPRCLVVFESPTIILSLRNLSRIRHKCHQMCRNRRDSKTGGGWRHGQGSKGRDQFAHHGSAPAETTQQSTLPRRVMSALKESRPLMLRMTAAWLRHAVRLCLTRQQ